MLQEVMPAVQLSSADLAKCGRLTKQCGRGSVRTSMRFPKLFPTPLRSTLLNTLRRTLLITLFSTLLATPLSMAYPLGVRCRMNLVPTPLLRSPL